MPSVVAWVDHGKTSSQDTAGGHSALIAVERPRGGLFFQGSQLSHFLVCRSPASVLLQISRLPLGGLGCDPPSLCRPSFAAASSGGLAEIPRTSSAQTMAFSHQERRAIHCKRGGRNEEAEAVRSLVVLSTAVAWPYMG